VRSTVEHTWYMIGRQVRNLARQPIWIALILIQPMIWLLLYGQLFQSIVRIPGFDATSYVAFLAPGVVIMNAFFGASWSGMAMIQDLDRSVIERFLATPASRASIVLSQVVRAGLTAVIQAVIILIVALALGVRVHAGVVGWLVVLASALLLAAAFAGLSHGLALIIRKEATMIAAVNFIGLPLMFLSAILIQQSLMPDWMQWFARVNPVNWGVVAARSAVLRGTDWGSIGLHLGLLAGLTVATSAFAIWAFRSYQRTL
jgi:ABC-2 type transport system permease protein